MGRLALPWPYVRGLYKPDTFEDHVQQNFEALARSVGELQQGGNYAIGNFQSHASTGNKQITGAGFKPTLVEFVVCLNTTANNTTGEIDQGFGRMTATAQSTNFHAADPNAANMSHNWSTSFCLWMKDRIGGSEYKAAFVSMDEDGFTINVSVADNHYRVFWTAHR